MGEYLMNNLASTSGVGYQHQESSPPPPPQPPQTDKKPKKKRTRKNSELASVACCVCGFTAGPHNYYGARACIPCRAFFRRSVEEQLFGAYVCYRTKDCDVKRTGRKSCKYCRYQACLKGGMKAVYVLNESQKEQLNKKKIKVKEEPSIGSFTSKDEEDIKRWTGLSRIFDQSKVRTFEKTVIKELIRLVMFTNPLSERS